MSWGLRTDVYLNTVVTVVGEVYGVGTAAPGYQAGLQLRPGAGWLEVDATVSHGTRGGTRRTWRTLGLVAALDVQR